MNKKHQMLITTAPFKPPSHSWRLWMQWEFYEMKTLLRHVTKPRLSLCTVKCTEIPSSLFSLSELIQFWKEAHITKAPRLLTYLQLLYISLHHLLTTWPPTDQTQPSQGIYTAVMGTKVNQIFTPLTMTWITVHYLHQTLQLYNTSWLLHRDKVAWTFRNTSSQTFVSGFEPASSWPHVHCLNHWLGRTIFLMQCHYNCKTLAAQVKPLYIWSFSHLLTRKGKHWCMNNCPGGRKSLIFCKPHLSKDWKTPFVNF